MEVSEAVKRVVDKLEGATQKREFGGILGGKIVFGACSGAKK